MTACGCFLRLYRLLAWLGLMAWWTATALVAYSLITYQVGVLGHAIFLGLFFGFGVVSGKLALLYHTKLKYIGFVVLLIAFLVALVAISAEHHRLFIEGLPLFD
ncbi:hypothetical protein NKT77_03605 [Moraxella sp. FZLJ2107]|uniref:hypothetical protein n=1 Tax=unclassified Moraxella TaxID=2685852 RepID=UPI0020C874BD|nr:MULTISPECIES: hypothetical protein [unclassified Moraxella]UTO05752.1 hypothetical protein NKT77_03605 [Moraxella sp. FZLJ2107]UTO22488.1 hypothetical protein NKU06_00385 [Moraxella sp. FZLJ2109]